MHRPESVSRLLTVVLGVVSLVQGSLSSAPNTKLQLNGWYPCGLSNAPSPNSTASKYASLSPFQCAEVEMPLCHEGVCKSDKTINVFLRRLLADAKQKQPAANKALWILQGGPGASSANMERIMLTMANHTNEKVDFYTMDHRGTGRSNFLECQAAQAFAQGSPSGVQIAYSEYSNCIKDLLFQMDNHTEAYSVTSAAKDIEVLVDRLHGPNVDAFVYGMSYGTYFTERIMHLAPKKVKGYILDGVIAEDDPTFSNWNTINLPIDARFVKLCEDDKFCSSKLSVEIKKHGNLTIAWRAIYKQLDDPKPNSENRCAAFIESVYGNDTKPSDYVKQYLDDLSGDVAKRLLIPAIMHRLYKCDDDDVEFLTMMLDPMNELRVSPSASAKALTSALSARSAQPAAFDQIKGMSPFLSALIKASEMWTFPSATWSQERQNFDSGLFSSDISSDFIENCILTANKSNLACTVFSEMAPGVDISALLNHPPFVYKRDKYWGKFATIPAQASVLVVNGELDFMTPSEWGAHEFENIKGDNKLMVGLDNGVHCAASRPTTFDDETECGFQIIASYVVSGGAIEKVDIKCINSLPALNFADLEAIQSVLPQVNSTEELYGMRKPVSTTSDPKLSGGALEPPTFVYEFLVLHSSFCAAVSTRSKEKSFLPPPPMRTPPVLGLVGSAFLQSPAHADAAVAPTKINGWFPCHESDANSNKSPAVQAPFGCTEVKVPHCHQGIYESTKTINLFVKRLLAKKPSSPRKAMWFLQGGPGYASYGSTYKRTRFLCTDIDDNAGSRVLISPFVCVVEGVVKLLNKTTDMSIDMYTADHRGTGRSNYLECQAAQALAAGSPDGVEIEISKIPNCIQGILFQIDNHTEAFSVTSAAKDVEYLINTLNGKDTEVFVYGASYGTYLSARVMHLASKQVKGYILDGTVDEKKATFTTWNENRGPLAGRFLQMYEKDKFCSSKLSEEIKTYGNLTAAIRAIYGRLDSAVPGQGQCADIFRRRNSTEYPKSSHKLRDLLGRRI